MNMDVSGVSHAGTEPMVQAIPSPNGIVVPGGRCPSSADGIRPSVHSVLGRVAPAPMRSIAIQTKRLSAMIAAVAIASPKRGFSTRNGNIRHLVDAWGLTQPLIVPVGWGRRCAVSLATNTSSGTQGRAPRDGGPEHRDCPEPRGQSHQRQVRGRPPDPEPLADPERAERREQHADGELEGVLRYARERPAEGGAGQEDQ